LFDRSLGTGSYFIGYNARLRRVTEATVSAISFTGLKVFSATKAREREELGETVTRWIRSNPGLEVVDRVVRQSSDDEFHCLTIILFYRERPTPAGA
jgi:hypothetical protein